MVPKRSLPALIGILAGAVAGLTVTQAVAASPYTIEGLTLGERLQLSRDYQCAASEQVEGFRWCQRLRQERGKLGSFSSTISALQNSDGTAVYLNRLVTPAFFGPNDIPAEIARLSSGFFSERAREIRLPPRAGLPSAVIAMWGKVQLEPLGGDVLAKLASEGPSGQSLLVDYLGDLKRSAQLGLPVLRLTGGAGYLWSASVYPNGRGHLRFLAVDASAAAPRTVVAEAVAVQPIAVKPVVQKPASKIASVSPTAVLTATPGLQFVPEVTGTISANTTVRAKSTPDQVELIKTENELAPGTGQWLAAEQIANASPRVAVAEPISYGRRMQTLVAVIGMVAISLFLLAYLIEFWRREPTGLELLELQRRARISEAHPDRESACAFPQRAASRVMRTISMIGVQTTLAARYLRRFAKSLALRISAPANGA
jgi:hypothetical protein